MKKTVITLENDFTDTDVVYRVANGYSAGPSVDGTTNVEMNYLNDRSKYKTNSVLNLFEQEQLQNFAEYHAGYNVLITNIGLIVFYETSNKKKLYIYDILDKTEEKLEEIPFDLSPFESYSEFITPMNYFYVEYKTTEGSKTVTFPIKKVYKKGSDRFYKAPVDYIGENLPESNGLFKLASDISELNTLEYNFSQGICIKPIKSTDDTLKISISLLQNNIAVYILTAYTFDGVNPLYIDLSNFPNGEIIKITMETASNAAESKYGLLEVLC